MKAGALRLVSWNCAGAFRRKSAALDQFDADVLVIQECEDPAVIGGSYLEWAGDHLWLAGGRHKGLGVFACKGHALEPLDWDNGGFGNFLPCRIDGAQLLLAIWARDAKSATFRYVRQIWHYLALNGAALGHNAVVCGDFNSNAIWNDRYRGGNHSDVVRALAAQGLVSAYHARSGEAHGQETRPTFYLQRNLEKPYHLDFAFVPQTRLASPVVIGEPADWLSLSDHMPLVLDLEASRG